MIRTHHIKMWLFTSVILTSISGLAHAAAPTQGLYINSEGSPAIALINEAKKSLYIEIYEMNSPGVLTAVRAALARGVKVNIVKEPYPVGDACKVFDNSPSSKDTNCGDQRDLVKEVRAAGGSYVPFAKSALCGTNAKSCLEHGKLIVIDEQKAMLSSGNLNGSSLCEEDSLPTKCNRDYSFVIEEPSLVRSLQAVAEKDRLSKTYDLKGVLSDEARNDLTIGPFALEPLVAFINSAQRSIRLQNQYLKEPSINDALVSAAKRGVKIELTVASACSFGAPSASDTNKVTTTYTRFDDAGIHTRMFTKNNLVNGLPGYMHAKAIVVDETRAWMGSVNGSTQATSINREFGIFFDDAASVSKLRQQMDKDHKSPKSESWQESLKCAEDSQG